MRVTNNMVFSLLSRGLLKANEDIIDSYEKLSSGEKVNRPSDDPVAIPAILTYKDMLSQLEQYKRNVEFAESYLTNSESAIKEANNILSRLREIAVEEASDTVDASLRQNAATEVDELFNELISIGNTKYGDRYLFSGYLYTTQPFDSSGTYSGDNNESSLEISQDATFTYGLTGNKIFKGVGISGGIDIYQKVLDLKTALQTDDTTGIQDAIGDMDDAISQIDDMLSEIGARMSRLSSRKTEIESFTSETEILLSGVEDADLTDVAVDLAQQQTSLEALQAATAKALNMTIFDFIG